MDFLSIANLLPEFLELLKGKDGGGLKDYISSGNTGMLNGIMQNSEKYIKYLPLIPLLGRVSKKGLKGLLSDSDDVSALLSVISSSENKYAKMLRNIDGETVARILPLVSEFFEKKQDKEVIEMTPEIKENIKALPFIPNPLSPVSEIADKEIIYALNRYISRENTA